MLNRLKYHRELSTYGKWGASDVKGVAWKLLSGSGTDRVVAGAGYRCECQDGGSPILDANFEGGMGGIYESVSAYLDACLSFDLLIRMNRKHTSDMRMMRVRAFLVSAFRFMRDRALHVSLIREYQYEDYMDTEDLLSRSGRSASGCFPIGHRSDVMYASICQIYPRFFSEVMRFLLRVKSGEESVPDDVFYSVFPYMRPEVDQFDLVMEYAGS